MWVSRYWLMIPVLAIAGSLAGKRATAVTAGTLPTHTPLFVAMLVGVVLLVGALTFVPALALGPDRRTPAAASRRLNDDHDSSRSDVRDGFLDRAIIVGALRGSFAKLDPRVQLRNPVMFVVYVGSIFTTGIGIAAATGAVTVAEAGNPGFVLAIAAWLWLTVLFANFAEAVAEGRGKAQAATLRSMRRHVQAKKLLEPAAAATTSSSRPARCERGDLVLVEANDTIPADGEVVEGVASVNESAVTGESAPVLREAGGDFSAVTGGTRVLSDWLVVRVTSREGEGFLDRMIAMVEGAKRGRTPNEIALSILLAMLTLVFLLATATLAPFSAYAVASAGHGTVVTLTVLVALLVCLIPTTIGGLLSAIGIAGMDRMIRANVIATSGRAVEAAGDVDVLLLDKTGTITLGDRQATRVSPGAAASRSASSPTLAQLASLADETPEGRSIVVLAKQQFQLRGRDLASTAAHVPQVLGPDAHERRRPRGPAAAQGRGGCDPRVRRGGRRHVAGGGRRNRRDGRARRRDAAGRGGAAATRVLGVIELRDIVKGGIRERFAELRQMGIKTVMVTGDNRLTAAAIAAEAGVDDFLAEATPETKLALIRKHQSRGPPRRHVRRRHQRCARARAGRRGRRDEHRHAGREGSRQHGRSRLEPDQADRGRRRRQADAGDARRADDVLGRERRREVLRDHSGRLRDRPIRCSMR